MVEVKCPECDSKYVNKDGQKNGKQRYKCKTCGRKFTQGEYIKTEKQENRKRTFAVKKKPIKNKKRIINIDNLINKKVNKTEIVMPIKLDEKIEKVIENDIIEEKINFEYYKQILSELSSDEENEIAKRLSVIRFNEIEILMNERLFQNHHNEKLDALIMKILIATGEKGMKSLIEYINNSNQYKMTKYNLNVIGKHMSQKLDISWNIIIPYIKEGISKNCIYTITRYINYVSKLSYIELRNRLSFDEVRTLYFNRKSLSIYSIFSLPKISDSDYLNNFDEFTYSLEKILNKMSKKELVNYNYLEQYKNSIFTEDSYVKDCLEGNRLSEKGNKIIGTQIHLFYKEYCKLEYRVLRKEYDALLDRYSNFIYTTLLEYGLEEFNSFFRLSSGKEYVFRCKIFTRETEKLAEKICEKYFDNPRTNYPDILDEVFENLLYSQNENAIDTLIYMIDNDIVDKNSTLFQNLSFAFVIGITEKIYGDFYNIKDDYAYRRINRGGVWEKLVGYILKENSKNVEYHPLLDNNKIPDYAEVIHNKIEKIQECKLVLGFRELKETITKYSPYCNFIEIYCIKNEIDENIINSEEYISLINSVQKEFNFIIKDYNDIYNMTNKYKETLEYFAKNVKETTQKNLLKEKICIVFDNQKREKILYLLDHTFKYSGLF